MSTSIQRSAMCKDRANPNVCMALRADKTVRGIGTSSTTPNCTPCWYRHLHSARRGSWANCRAVAILHGAGAARLRTNVDSSTLYYPYLYLQLHHLHHLHRLHSSVALTLVQTLGKHGQAVVSSVPLVRSAALTMPLLASVDSL